MFNRVRVAAGRRTEAGDGINNGAINETLRHTLDISQGSEATHLFWQWDNCENRFIFAKVKAHKMVPFLGHPVFVYNSTYVYEWGGQPTYFIIILFI